MKRGAIFDMDGTLFDTEGLYVKAWTETADLFGVERHPTLGLEMGGTNQAAALKVFADHYPQLDAKKYFDMMIKIIVKWIKTDLQLFPGTQEILN